MKSTQEPTTATAVPSQSEAVLLPSLAPAPAVAQIPIGATQTLTPDEARRARRRVAGDARKRIANACLACKSRKQKCDGKQPCNICRRRGADCIYVEQPPRQTKRRPQSSSVAGSIYAMAGDGTSERTNLTRSPSPGGHRRNHPNRSSAQLLDWGHSFPGDDPGNIHTLRSQKIDDLRQRAAKSQAGSGESADTDSGRMAVVDGTPMLSDPRGRLSASQMRWLHRAVSLTLHSLYRGNWFLVIPCPPPQSCRRHVRPIRLHFRLPTALDSGSTSHSPAASQSRHLPSF
jgi:hypothetical protein